MSKFYEQETVCAKLQIQKDMIPLTEQEKWNIKMPLAYLSSFHNKVNFNKLGCSQSCKNVISKVENAT